MALGFLIIEDNKDTGSLLILIGLILFMVNFGATLGPIIFVIIPEIVDASFIPYSVFMNWFASAITVLLFPIISELLPNKNPAIIFAFFAIWCIISYIVNKKYLVETKNKTSKEIQ